MTMTKMYIVGTYHKYQFGPCHEFEENLRSAHEEFAIFLKDCCVRLNVKTLAEEMHFDARDKYRIKQTVPERVAESLHIEHADCDPNIKEQVQLDILNEGRVKILGLYEGLSEKTVHANIRREYDKREDEWIRRLAQLSHFPVLFICGCEHSASLLEKATQHGFSAHLIVKEWTPNKELKATR